MGPRSKIAQLPEEIRAWLHKAIVERGFGDIVALTEELNALCKQGGVAISIGKSAVGEESKKVKRAQEAIRATTEAAKLIAESSRDDSDSRSEAAIALVQSQVFDLLLELREADDEADPVERMKVMTKVAKSLSEMSRARVNQAKWRTEVEGRAKAAADKVAKLAKKGGMDAGTVAEIRASILGIVKREPAQPAEGTA
ncbi:MAG: DUF3486 family protein [Burkholderiaceae bacterium]|nr:DUF3486 family protein [Burkholderiaceae bacterium]